MGLASDMLLIADDSTLRNTLNGMLGSSHEAILPVLTGAALIDEVVRRGPRIVLVQDDLRGRDGLQFAAEILKVQRSTVVLIARSERRAVDAYEAGITDFLLSPLRRERLLATLARANQRMQAPLRPSGEARPLLRFRSKRGFMFVRDAEIVWIGAASNYLEVHCIAEAHRVRGTMENVSRQLQGYPQFLRIHRSIIINADYLREVRSSGNGDSVVVLNDCRELPVSRKDILDEWIARVRDLSCNSELGDKVLPFENRGAPSAEASPSSQLRSLLQHSGLN